MGIQSHGMLLVGSFEEKMEILSMEGLPPGSKIS
jgi:hypothetical protein